MRGNASSGRLGNNSHTNPYTRAPVTEMHLLTLRER